MTTSPQSETSSAADWTVVLDRLEHDLDASERGEVVGPWEPPQLQEPLPASLRERAQLILGRQQAARLRLEDELRRRRERGEARPRPSLVHTRSAPAQPVYLDREI